MSNEQLLVKQSLEGNMDSFSEIILIYHYKLRAFMVKLGASVHDSEDLIQEVFIKVYKNLDKYDSQKNFSTWIHTIAVNTWKNHIKKEQHAAVAITEDNTDKNVNVSDSNFESLERKEIISQMFNYLSDDTRQIIVLRFFHDMKFKEIGEVMGITTENAKMRIARALEKLQIRFGNCLKGGVL